MTVHLRASFVAQVAVYICIHQQVLQLQRRVC